MVDLMSLDPSHVNRKFAACLLRFVAEAFHRGQNLIGRFGPFERLGILVVPIDESADIGLEFPD